MKRFFIIVLFASSVLFVPGVSHASGTYSQNDYSIGPVTGQQTMTEFMTDGLTLGPINYVTFTTQAGLVLYDNSGDPNGIRIGYNCSAAGSGSGCTAFNSGSIGVTSTSPFGAGYQTVTFMFSSPLVMTTDYWYIYFGGITYNGGLAYSNGWFTGSGSTPDAAQYSNSSCAIGGSPCNTLGLNTMTVNTPPSSGPSGGASISFVYPTSSTPLFSNFLLHASGLAASGSYEARVTWSAASFSGGQSSVLTQMVGDLYFQYPDWYPVIPRSDWGYDFATNTVISAEADLLDSQDPNNPGADLAQPVVIASTTTSFVLLAVPNSGGDVTQGGNFILDTQSTTGTVSIATTTGFSVYALSTSSAGCYWTASSSVFDLGDDLGYSGCWAGNFFLTPSQWAIDGVQSSFNLLQGDPPFSYVFSVFNAISAQANALQSATTTSLSFEMDAALPAVVPKASITIIGSSTFAAFSGSSTSSVQSDRQDQLFAAEDWVMTLFFVFLAFDIVTKPRIEYH